MINEKPTTVTARSAWERPEIFTTGVEKSMGALYLTHQYSIVKREGEALLIELPNTEGHARKVRVPLIKIDQVVLVGEITITALAVHELLRRRISIHYLTQHGRSCGSVAPDPTKNASIRLAQYRNYADSSSRFVLAQRFVAGKLRNLRTLLLRYERKHQTASLQAAIAALKATSYTLTKLAPSIVEPNDRMHGLGQILGCEGQGSSSYFGVFGSLLHSPWSFSGRVRRPPRDPVNALLSFGYTILTNQTVSLINVVGLDPNIGFLHSPGFGKPALALDIIEEFRPIIVDSVVLTLLNSHVLRPQDFVDELGSVRLVDGARKLFLEKLEERFSTSIQHPYFGYSTTYRRCIELQVRLLAKTLQGEVPTYVPFLVR